MSFSKEYHTWAGMKVRVREYPTYIAKGIKVCDRWLESFDNFFKDMGKAPSRKHTLDRIDNNGNYCPENCRWATTKEQNNNYSQNRVIEFNGKTMNVTQWAEFLGISRHRIYQRLNKGWSVEKALTYNQSNL